MSGVKWSLNDALSEGVDLVGLADLERFRAAASGKKIVEAGYSDTIVLHIFNSEISMSIAVATCVDEYDPTHLADQERFKAAYAKFTAEIASLTDSIRQSVELPANYIQQIDESILLNYAKPRPGGRPQEWRRDEFFLSLLLLYQVTTGKRPAGTVDGPTVRFMREVVAHLCACLPGAIDRRDLLPDVVDLWKLPVNETFLKDWFQNKGGAAKIHARIDTNIGRRRLVTPLWQ